MKKYQTDLQHEKLLLFLETNSVIPESIFRDIKSSLDKTLKVETAQKADLPRPI